jgi:hypothetical protein
MSMKRSKKPMDKLDDAEREELASVALCEQLGRDMRILRSRSTRYQCGQELSHPDIDRYLRFLSEINAFANHARKPFRRILDGEMKI